jgi:hypothetical protein
MKYVIFSLFLGLIVSITSCKSPQELESIKLSDISWLIGQWQTDPLQRVEVWSLRANVLNASGLILGGEKPKVNEVMQIESIDGNLIYSVLVYNQNDNEYVHFELANKDPQDLMFTNPDHDFPKMIRYTLEEQNRLKVSIGDGDEVAQTFLFFRSI